ncbi:universal stress protein [Desulfitobacterium sp.]|uniref:universal stress protein n=1 Tax=Desulfitobacterium sp. TaxID=49981 RepID=UPI002C95CFAF|nr:universal stress protein [Desulfitobacterium sp.]HVJ49651.1 universal stress protein [Desulfitobacterium sp.]
MYKRILVPTDISEPSRRALLTALQLAEHLDSEIILFHVIPIPALAWDYYGSNSYNFSQEEINQMGDAALEAALTGIDIGQVKVQKKFVLGYPAQAIINETKKDIDMVIIGTRGHGPIAGAIIGSVTQRVLVNAPCPVLVTK